VKRVLFVDDDPNVVQGLRRMLRSVRYEWQVGSATSGEEALEAIRHEPFDVIVSDMKMPGIDGAELLTRVKSLQPDSVRIILSGHSERHAVMKSVAPAHQFLSKPCEAEALKETIERAYALRDFLGTSKIKELVSGIDFLPGAPSLHRELVQELEAPNPSLTKIAKVIEQDIGMSGNILKVVNSAYFGLFKPVISVERAVTYLGLETIGDLSRIPVFSEYKGLDMRGFSVEALGRHSRRTAGFARSVAVEEKGSEELAGHSFQAGMLHDVGKLVLAAGVPERYGRVVQRAAERGVSVSEVEQEELGATHAQIGAYLLGLWGLPEPIVEAVAYHTKPMDCPWRRSGVLTAVHVANSLALEIDGSSTANDPPRIELEYLRSLKIDHRLKDWRNACLQCVEQAG